MRRPAVQADARRRLRHARVRAVARRAEWVERELSELDLALLAWDGVEPSVLQLGERFDRLEAAMRTIEAELKTLRHAVEADEPPS